jgi:hypothetical protein
MHTAPKNVKTMTDASMPVPAQQNNSETTQNVDGIAKSTPIPAKVAKKPKKIAPMLVAPVHDPSKDDRTITINLNLNLQNPEDNIFSIRDLIKSQIKVPETKVVDGHASAMDTEGEADAADGDDESDIEDGKEKPKTKEEPVKKTRRKRADSEDEYDVEDPFVDDSEILQTIAEEGLRKPARTGYFIWRGTVETTA